jgi:prepilin-type N-terminal cleavage/methylation domain-containing protein
MKSFYSSTKSSAAQQGHTLVELLVAISLGSVVLAFLGGVLLVSEMRVSARIQRNLDAKDAANRTIDLLRREANFSSRIDSGDGLGTAVPLANCDNTPLTFHQNNSAKPICYKTVAPSHLTHIGVFQGPCVIVRLGYPYRSTGDIDPSSRVTSVLLDGVAETGSGIGCSSKGNIGLTAQLPSNPYRIDDAVAPPNRIANVRIKMDSEASYAFSVRVPSNLAYDGIDLFRNCGQDEGICDSNSTQVHYLPENTNITTIFQGPELKENLFYFRYPSKQYQVTGSSNSEPCTYANCTVTGTIKTVQLKNVDAIIFPDKEIRPTR